jgi:hypothetical protein
MGIGCAGRALLGGLCCRDFGNHPRLMYGWRVDFQDLEVVGASHLVVHDGGRLQHAVARTEGELTLLAFIKRTQPFIT